MPDYMPRKHARYLRSRVSHRDCNQTDYVFRLSAHLLSSRASLQASLSAGVVRECKNDSGLVLNAFNFA
jgi:hypothetical protein